MEAQPWKDSCSKALVPGGEAKKGMSLLRAVASTMKMILGSGILSLSWAFYNSTMLPGLIFTIFSGFFAAYNYILLGHCSEITGKRKYSSIWSHLFGRKLAWLPDLLIITNSLLASLAYLIIIGDYLPRGLWGIGVDWAPLQDRQIAILLVWVLVLPLNFLRDLSLLGYTSIVGTVGVLYTCGVLVHAAVQRVGDEGDWQSCHMGKGIFLMMPTVAFTFVGHYNAVSLYQQLERRSFRRWVIVSILGFGCSFLIITACAVSGYVMFGSDMSLEGRSNVLNAPEFKKRPEMMAAYLATAFSVAFTIPLQTQAACDSVDALWTRASPYTIEQLDPAGRRSGVAFVAMVVILALSMVLTELGIVAAVTGAVQATSLMFILPSMMYLKCTAASGDKLSCVGVVVHRVLPRISIATGFIVGTLGVISALF